jgi:hypothetical protein
MGARKFIGRAPNLLKKREACRADDPRARLRAVS